MPSSGSNFLCEIAGTGTQESQLAMLTMLIVQLKLENLAKTPSTQTAKVEERCKQLMDFLTEAHIAEPQLFRETAFYNVTAKLITAHGQISVMLNFAELMQRLHYTINYHIHLEEYEKACDILCSKCTDGQSVTLWYDFSPVLIRETPKQTFEGLKGHGDAVGC